MHATPVRRRVAGATMALGAILVGMSLLAPSAYAEDAPAFFDPASYDTTLHGPHRGTSADSSGFPGECPDDESVAGLTAWHLVLGQGDSFTSGTLDVRVTIDGVGVTLNDLTAADDFDSFDPATNYLQHNDGQQAYVYAGDGDDVLVDAAANVADGAADKIVLSHICPGEGETDDGGTDQVAEQHGRHRGPRQRGGAPAAPGHRRQRRLAGPHRRFTDPHRRRHPRDPSQPGDQLLS
jgi:hypothetical protein